MFEVGSSADAVTLQYLRDGETVIFVFSTLPSWCCGMVGRGDSAVRTKERKAILFR